MNYAYARFKAIKIVPVPKPHERALCPECQSGRKVKKDPTKQFWTYEGPGFFCSTKCAVDWANKVCTDQIVRIKEQTG